MSDAEELARKERRRRLIERLNEKEKLIADLLIKSATHGRSNADGGSSHDLRKIVR